MCEHTRRNGRADDSPSASTWLAAESAWHDGGMLRSCPSPHISPAFVARASRCRARWSFRSGGPAGVPSTVRRWGSCAEVKARGGSRCPSIVDDEQRRDRPRPPSARRVTAPLRGLCPDLGSEWPLPAYAGVRPPLASITGLSAPWARLRRCRSLAMKDIAVVAAPRIRTHGAHNGQCWGPRPDLAGRGARTCSTSSTPRRENTAGCGASAPAAESW